MYQAISIRNHEVLKYLLDLYDPTFHKYCILLYMSVTMYQNKTLYNIAFLVQIPVKGDHSRATKPK